MTNIARKSQISGNEDPFFNVILYMFMFYIWKPNQKRKEGGTMAGEAKSINKEKEYRQLPWGWD